MLDKVLKVPRRYLQSFDFLHKIVIYLTALQKGSTTHTNEGDYVKKPWVQCQNVQG